VPCQAAHEGWTDIICAGDPARSTSMASDAAPAAGVAERAMVTDASPSTGSLGTSFEDEMLYAGAESTRLRATVHSLLSKIEASEQENARLAADLQEAHRKAKEYKLVAEHAERMLREDIRACPCCHFQWPADAQVADRLLVKRDPLPRPSSAGGAGGGGGGEQLLRLAVRDRVEVLVENEPGVYDTERERTLGAVGEILKDDGSQQPFLVLLPDGRQSWYKVRWLTKAFASSPERPACRGIASVSIQTSLPVGGHASFQTSPLHQSTAECQTTRQELGDADCQTTPSSQRLGFGRPEAALADVQTSPLHASPRADVLSSPRRPEVGDSQTSPLHAGHTSSPQGGILCIFGHPASPLAALSSVAEHPGSPSVGVAQPPGKNRQTPPSHAFDQHEVSANVVKQLQSPAGHGSAIQALAESSSIDTVCQLEAIELHLGETARKLELCLLRSGDELRGDLVALPSLLRQSPNSSNAWPGRAKRVEQEPRSAYGRIWTRLADLLKPGELSLKAAVLEGLKTSCGQQYAMLCAQTKIKSFLARQFLADLHRARSSSQGRGDDGRPSSAYPRRLVRPASVPQLDFTRVVVGDDGVDLDDDDTIAPIEDVMFACQPIHGVKGRPHSSPLHATWQGPHAFGPLATKPRGQSAGLLGVRSFRGQSAGSLTSKKAWKKQAMSFHYHGSPSTGFAEQLLASTRAGLMPPGLSDRAHGGLSKTRRLAQKHMVHPLRPASTVICLADPSSLAAVGVVEDYLPSGSGGEEEGLQ